MADEELRESRFTLEIESPQELVLRQQEESKFNLVLATPIAISDYENLINKPQINSVTLSGNLSFQDLGFPDPSLIPTEPLSNEDLDDILI